MDVAIDVDHARRLVRFVIGGRPDTKLIIAAVDEMSARLDGRTGYDVYSDHRALTEPITPDQGRQLLSHIGRTVPAVRHRRWAVVVSSPASFGMMRMLGVLAQEIPVHVAPFWNPEDAEAWLGEARAASSTPAGEERS